MIRKLLCLSLITSCLWAIEPKPKPPAHAGEPAEEARDVRYKLGRVEPIYVMHDWATTVLLPPGEKYDWFYYGDPYGWSLNAQKGASYVVIAPDKNKKKLTNLTVVAQSGNVYVFKVIDVSTNPKGHADSTVALHLIDSQMQTAINHPPMVPAEQLDAMRAKTEKLETRLLEQKQESENQLEAAVALAHLQDESHPPEEYHFSDAKKAKRAGIAQMWTTNGHTYATRIPGVEVAAFYEKRDGKIPAFTKWELKDDQYFIPRRVQEGYFVVGNKDRNRVAVTLKGYKP